MITTLWNAGHHYYEQIPKETCQAIAQSAFLSFSATWLVSKIFFDANVQMIKPIAAGAVAGTASLIHGLTAPFFHKLFGNKEVKYETETLKYFTQLTVVYLLLRPVLAQRVSLLRIIFTQTLCMNNVKSGFDLFARVLEWINQPAAANKFRHIMAACYLGIDKEANSAYYTLVI